MKAPCNPQAREDPYNFPLCNRLERGWDLEEAEPILTLLPPEYLEEENLLMPALLEEESCGSEAQD